jgi:hypothetical protein
MVPSLRSARLKSAFAEILVTMIPGEVNETPQPTPWPTGFAKRVLQQRIAAAVTKTEHGLLEEVTAFFIVEPP